MPGLFPARSWPTRPASIRVVVVVAAAVLMLTLTGCKGIDKSQWREFPLSTTDSEQRVVVEQEQRVSTSDDSGVIGGSNRGSRRSSTARVVVATDPGTCWLLVVDGNSHRGCGPATISDVYGTCAGRVTKLSGSTPIKLALLDSSGHTITSGKVISNHRYVTVRS